MRRKIIAATVGLLLLGSVTAYGYVAVTTSATITVNEALYIDVALVDVGTTPTRTFCTLSTDKGSATCAVDVYPGESGQIGITLNNKSSAALTTTETAASSSTDVTLTINTPTASVPGNGSKFFSTSFVVSSSATPGRITINLSFSR